MALHLPHFDPLLHPKDPLGRWRVSNRPHYKTPGERLAERRAEVLDGARTTRERWMRWSPSRQRMVYRYSRQPLHRAILDDHLEGITPPSDRPPRAVFLMGGAGTGKSRLLHERLSHLLNNAVHADPDEFKQRLPEWDELIAIGDPDAAHAVHDESRDISAALQWEARERGLDMVIDGTGAGPSFMKRLAEMKDAGYEVDVVWADCSTEEALRRNARRERSLRESLVRLVHRDASRRLPEVVGDTELIDSVLIYNTESWPPTLTYRRTGRQDEIADPDALERLWLKSRERLT